MPLELIHPADPYIVTQAFGIYNTAYEQFGFNRHNGIDFKVDKDGIVVAMCDGIVTEVKEYPNGAGRSVRIRTLTPVRAEGWNQYVEFFYMHAEKPLVKVDQQVKAGDPIIVADNTGFSTGPHTHISAYFIDRGLPTGSNKLPFGSKDSDYCFDFSKYYQVSPEASKVVLDGLSIVRQSLPYPSLRQASMDLLKALGALLGLIK